MDIDIDFDFTTDTPKYWDNFWEQDDVLGVRNNDPDICIKHCKSIINFYGVKDCLMER